MKQLEACETESKKMKNDLNEAKLQHQNLTHNLHGVLDRLKDINDKIKNEELNLTDAGKKYRADLKAKEEEEKRQKEA